MLEYDSMLLRNNQSIE